jgi:hypothetical protein
MRKRRRNHRILAILAIPVYNHRKWLNWAELSGRLTTTTSKHCHYHHHSHQRRYHCPQDQAAVAQFPANLPNAAHPRHHRARARSLSSPPRLEQPQPPGLGNGTEPGDIRKCRHIPYPSLPSIPKKQFNPRRPVRLGVLAGWMDGWMAGPRPHHQHHTHTLHRQLGPRATLSLTVVHLSVQSVSQSVNQSVCAVYR